MDINPYLLMALLAALLAVVYLWARLRRVHSQLSLHPGGLNGYEGRQPEPPGTRRGKRSGQANRYDINQIAMSSQAQLIRQKQSQQAYKRLMTSLSHDVKTPLASLVGYLEAVESGMVTGKSGKRISAWRWTRPIA